MRAKHSLGERGKGEGRQHENEGEGERASRWSKRTDVDCEDSIALSSHRLRVPTVRPRILPRALRACSAREVTYRNHPSKRKYAFGMWPFFLMYHCHQSHVAVAQTREGDGVGRRERGGRGRVLIVWAPPGATPSFRAAGPRPP